MFRGIITLPTISMVVFSSCSVFLRGKSVPVEREASKSDLDLSLNVSWISVSNSFENESLVQHTWDKWLIYLHSM